MQASHSKRFQILLVALLVSLLSACGPVREEGAFPAPSGRGAELEQAGNYAEAAQTYLQQAAAAAAPERQDFQLRAVAALLRAHLVPQATALLGRIDTTGLKPPFGVRKDLLRAQIALAEGKAEQALQLTQKLPTDLPLPLRTRSQETRAQAYMLAGNLLESARTRVALEPLLQGPAAIEKNHKAIWGALTGLSAEALQRLRTEPPPDVLSGWMELAYILKKARLQPDQLDAEVASWRSRYPHHPATQFLDQLLAQQRHFQQRPGTVALLLPLSGKLADAAAAIRDGFLAAYYTEPQQRRKTVIRIYDTSPYAANIRDLYRRVVKDGADFIVGPLNKDTVSTLARAGKPDVPVLALNFTEPPDIQVPENFYQFSLSPEGEARQVAERASMDGLNRAVAIVPDGEWGARLLKAFTTRFEQLGGEVLDAERYNPTNNDFSRPIRHMLNLDQSRARYNTLRNITGRRDIKFEPRRRQDVDFVFMAAFPRQARLIAPQLRFYHAADLPVYTTSSAYSGTPDPRADRDMDGVVFCDTPWTLGMDPSGRLYQQINGLWPQSMDRFARLYALGIDAYNIIPYLPWLRQEPYERYAGETGSLYMGTDDRIHRTLQWARFIDGKASVIQRPVTPVAALPATKAPEGEPIHSPAGDPTR